MTTQPGLEPLVLLVHGAWHGAWAWAEMQAELDRRGVPSLAIDLPGHGASTLPFGDLHGDAAHVTQIIELLARPVVLVGHSYGGAVVTEAAGHTPWARSLVYLAAFALAPGEAVRDVSRSVPGDLRLRAATVRREDGTSVLDPAGAAEALYASCPPGVAAAAIARLCPQPIATFTQPVTVDPRSSISSSYVVCSRDEAVHPEAQRMMARRCTTSVELDTDHSPHVSAVGPTADVIAAAYAVL